MTKIIVDDEEIELKDLIDQHMKEQWSENSTRIDDLTNSLKKTNRILAQLLAIMFERKLIPDQELIELVRGY